VRGLCQPMVDGEVGAGGLKGMAAEQHAPRPASP
jgi:hypothetical protein